MFRIIFIYLFVKEKEMFRKFGELIDELFEVDDPTPERGKQEVKPPFAPRSEIRMDQVSVIHD